MKATTEIFDTLLPDLIAAMPEAGEDSGYALPEATRTCLGGLVREAGVRRVFEFGSGRSTRTFLEAGCEVISLEDSQAWVDETLQAIRPDDAARLRPLVQPLQTIWHRGVPMKGWQRTSHLQEALEMADLVLIESPAWAPFREFPLIQSLTYAKHAIIAVDDANIPTVKRFCERLAGDRSRVLSIFAPKDHGVFFFGRKLKEGCIDDRRGLLETVKAWRRFCRSMSTAT